MDIECDWLTLYQSSLNISHMILLSIIYDRYYIFCKMIMLIIIDINNSSVDKMPIY
jgi:hypothetical protein